MSATYQRAVHWFRRDLRLTDNTGLQAAVAQSQEIIPCYLLSDWSGSHRWTGAKRQTFNAFGISKREVGKKKRLSSVEILGGVES
jgi:hypothetical protein